jgi:hypothetical protein
MGPVCVLVEEFVGGFTSLMIGKLASVFAGVIPGELKSTLPLSLIRHSSYTKGTLEMHGSALKLHE